MSTQQAVPFPESRIAELLERYVGDEFLPAGTYGTLSRYLELLLRWNLRMNLTAIRDPEEIVQRHFGESLFCGIELARRLQPRATLLDFGSGAGFPGLPIQILLPELQVTLAESQGKKVAFLREAVRSLCAGADIWPARVEAMPEDRRFDAVVLRAVDNMPQALVDARRRLASSGWLATLSGDESGGVPTGIADRVQIPGRTRSWIYFEPAL